MLKHENQVKPDHRKDQRRDEEYVISKKSAKRGSAYCLAAHQQTSQPGPITGTRPACSAATTVDQTPF